MPAPAALSPTDLRKLPPEAGDLLLARGEWSWCAMEHSRIGAVELVEPGSPFHHLALPLERRPLRFTFTSGNRRQHARNGPGMVAMVAAGDAGRAHWDDVYESACLYFTDAALAEAMGVETGEVRHEVRTRMNHRSPALARLVHALFADAAAGQPHGALIGDAVFLALAAEVAPLHIQQRRTLVRSGEPWRVRNAMTFIHSNLTGDLSIATIADAAATSPFHLNRTFRLAVGCSIWRYVLGARARYAAVLLRDQHLSLAGVAANAGFNTYPAFIAAVRCETGVTPMQLRKLAKA